jgi:molybdenum cofactor cytidylyltransferase
MGGPKALLERDGVPLLLLHVERALELGIAHVSAIVRPDVSDRLAPQLAPHRGRLSLLAARTGSQASSLTLLVRELAQRGRLHRDRPFLITPVDVLPCTPSTFRALCTTLTPGAMAATPTHRGRGGHPVLVRGELLASYLEGPLDAPPTLRDVLRGAGTGRKRVEVQDPTIRSDLDTPEQAEDHRLTLPWWSCAT